MNVLLTSVGRRTYLLDYFRTALAGRGRVFAANTTGDSVGMMLADVAFIVPAANNPAYIDAILGICSEHGVMLVLSLHDWEAPFLAAHSSRFRAQGIQLVVSSPTVMDLCLDKYKTYEFAVRHEIATPATLKSLPEARQALADGYLHFPLVIKPRQGQGSIGLEFVEEEWELEACHRRGLRACARMTSNGMLQADGAEALLIQERIRGDEYVLDVVNDFKGGFVCCLAKRKLSMRAGETDHAETLDDDRLSAFGRRIGEGVGHVGIMGVDVIMVGDTPHLIEMNPRFTGHYPFSHMAGANIPAAILSWAEGKTPRAEWLRVRPGVKSFKGISIIPEKIN